MTQVNQIHHLNDLTITTNEEKDVRMENSLCHQKQYILFIENYTYFAAHSDSGH